MQDLKITIRLGDFKLNQPEHKSQFEVTVTMTLRFNDQLIDEWLPDAVQENLEEGEEILSYTDTSITHKEK